MRHFRVCSRRIEIDGCNLTDVMCCHAICAAVGIGSCALVGGREGGSNVTVIQKLATLLDSCRPWIVLWCSGQRSMFAVLSSASPLADLQTVVLDFLLATYLITRWLVVHRPASTSARDPAFQDGIDCVITSSGCVKGPLTLCLLHSRKNG